MKLYEFGPTRSIRVRWTLQELGVPFEPVTVNLMAGEHRSAEFLKIKLLGGFPGLIEYMKRMYARPNAPPRIAEAFARVKR